MCMMNGLFSTIEVKKSAQGFACKDKEIKKFIGILNTLHPDVALIMFEKYSEETTDEKFVQEKLSSAIKLIKENCAPNIYVKSIVRSEVDNEIDFIEICGVTGDRILRFLNQN